MATEQQSPDRVGTSAGPDDHGDHGGKVGLDRSDDDQDFVDQSKIDFDPDDGLYSGTAVDGSSEIPGPHLDGETGELSPEDIQRQAEEEAGDVDPAETPAAKSSVAKAHEAKQKERAEGDGDQGRDESE